MSRKSKGISAERELVHRFWKTGNWACHRIAGSGSSKYPSPDLIASNNIRKLAIECKTIKSNSIYLKKEEITALKEFSRMFGAESWLSVRFNMNDWLFFNLEDLKETEKNYCANLDMGKFKGLLFEELIK